MARCTGAEGMCAGPQCWPGQGNESMGSWSHLQVRVSQAHTRPPGQPGHGINLPFNAVLKLACALAFPSLRGSPWQHPPYEGGSVSVGQTEFQDKQKKASGRCPLPEQPQGRCQSRKKKAGVGQRDRRRGAQRQSKRQIRLSTLFLSLHFLYFLPYPCAMKADFLQF